MDREKRGRNVKEFSTDRRDKDQREGMVNELSEVELNMG